MVVCDSYEQAEMMSKIFNEKYSKSDSNKDPKKISSSELILYDVGSKEEREKAIENFKFGKIDILFVYNMLLTGFDSPRLKKIYLGRKIKSPHLTGKGLILSCKFPSLIESLNSSLLMPFLSP